MVEPSSPPPALAPDPPDEDAAPRRPLVARLVGSAAAAAAVTLVLGPGVGLATAYTRIPPTASVAAIVTLFFAAGLSFLVEERGRGSIADAAWRRVVVGALSGLFFMAAWTWANHVQDQVTGWAVLAEHLDELIMELIGGCALGALFGAPLGAAFFVRARSAARGPEALGWLLAAGGPALLFAWFGGMGGVLVGLLLLLGAALAPLALAGAARLVRARDPGPLPPPELDPRPGLAAAALVVATAAAITGPHVRPREGTSYWTSDRRQTHDLPGLEVQRRDDSLYVTDGDEDVLRLVVAMAERLRSTGRAGASLPELVVFGLHEADSPGRPRFVRLHAPRRQAGQRRYFFGAAIDRRDGQGTEAWAWADLEGQTPVISWWSHDSGPTRPLRPVMR